MLCSLDNPFRDWEGREHISLSNAHKARDQYKKTRKAIQTLDSTGTDIETNDESHIESIIAEYTQFFNKLDRRTGIIETIFCLGQIDKANE